MDHISYLWSAHAIAPHRLKGFKLSKDLAFEEKFWDVVGLYLNLPIVHLRSAAMRRASVRLSSAVNPVCPCAHVASWLKRHRRFHFHFTPTSPSWLNLVTFLWRNDL